MLASWQWNLTLKFKENKKASLTEERFVAIYPTNIIILRGGE